MRRQTAAHAGELEVQVLDYQNTAADLLPLLAQAYALLFMVRPPAYITVARACHADQSIKLPLGPTGAMFSFLVVLTLPEHHPLWLSHVCYHHHLFMISYRLHRVPSDNSGDAPRTE